MAEKLDNNLHKWAVDLTRQHRVFNQDHPLNPENFSNLTKDERLQPILNFLIRHIRPPEEQRQIKLNLKHAEFRKRLAGAEKEVSPVEEMFRLKAAIIDSRGNVSSEIKEIEQLSQKKEEYHQRETELRRRLALLRVVEEEKKRETQHCNSWNDQLKCLLDNVPVNSNTSSTNDKVIDPTLQRLLRSNLLNIETLRHDVTSGHLVSQESIHEGKLRLWEEVGEIIRDWGPKPLLMSLLGEVREGQRNLQSLIQYVDLSRDAHELRLKCEKDGSFIDEMNPCGVIESVRELLGHMSSSHVKLYMEAHRADEAAESLSRACNSLTNNVITAIKRTYDEKTVNAVIKLVKENIAVVGERAALEMTNNLASSLQERANTATRARNALISKYAKILSFNKEVKSRVDSIHCLAVTVKEALHGIKDHQMKLKSNISNVLTATTSPTPVSVNSLSQECQSFNQVPLASLLTTNIDEYGFQPKKVMTTTPLVWQDKAIVEPGFNALVFLGSSQSCWNGVYDIVVEKVNRTTALHKQMEQLQTLRATASEVQKNTKMLTRQEVQELNEKAEEHDKKLDEKVRKLIGIYEEQINMGEVILKRMNRLINEWWEQPAKNVVIAPLVK